MSTEITVAIVDDSETDRYICKRMLSGGKRPYRFLEFDDGEPAAKYLIEDGPSGVTTPYPPHLVLVDINMPLVDGYELIERITPHLQAADYTMVIVMMMSSSSRKQDIDRAMEMPLVSDYIVKGSMSPEEFQSKIESSFSL